MKILGIPASPGVVVGRAFVYDDAIPQILNKNSNSNSITELARYRDAVETSKKEITSLRELSRKKLGEAKAQVFDAHLLLLQDPEFTSQVEKYIEEEKVTSEWAVDKTAQSFIQLFESMDDEYMRERADDIKDVFNRTKRHLLGIKTPDLSLIEKEVILVANDITPSETASMDKKFILGFLSNTGGKTSHSAIMARAMDIPAIVGLKNVTDLVKDGDLIAFDGTEACLYINPTDEELDSLKLKKEALQSQKIELESLKGLPAITTDGKQVEMGGNIGQFQDLRSFAQNDGEVIGLYRTEYLYMDRHEMPTEEEQYEAYAKIVTELKGKECVFRTLDIGGDKQIDYLDIGKEENPFLGYRAIRICLKEPELFKTQLRAILRTSKIGKISIMFPMISSLQELLEAKKILKGVMQDLESKDLISKEKIKIGMMIEVPSSALISDILAKEVDFFSIGTNDLTQYTCAVDRMNEKISELYDSFNPGLLRLIHLVSENAKKQNVKLAICGSMAHDPLLVPLFLAMDFHELSMSPLHILPTKKLIRSLNYQSCKTLLDKVMQLGSSTEIIACLTEFQKEQA